jgi:DNA polymerase III subunit epsilon
MIWFIAALALLIVLFRLFRPSKPESKVDLTVLPERFVVLDLETTGLHAEQHEIIEIGAIRVNRNSTTHETFQTLVTPTLALPKKIIGMTGITQSMIDSEGIPLQTAMTAFLEFIGDLPLVAFNAEFDMAFLEKAAYGQGISIKNKVSCALQMSRRAWPGLKSYRLRDLGKRGGLAVNGEHRALADCQLALTVYTSAGSKLGTDC